MVLIEKTENTAVQISATEFKGRRFLDVRNFFRNKETGEWMPTKKGISIPEDFIDEVIEAMMHEAPEV